MAENQAQDEERAITLNYRKRKVQCMAVNCVPSKIVDEKILEKRRMILKRTGHRMKRGPSP